MRQIVTSLTFGTLLLVAAGSRAQQPQIVHAQLSSRAPAHGLGAELESLKRSSGPVWVGYTVPVAQRFTSGWSSDPVAYLEGDRPVTKQIAPSESSPQDRAVLLYRVANGTVGQVRVEGPDRQIDAGGLRFVWLTDVAVNDSVTVLKALAMSTDARHLRDSAVFAISIHQSAETTPALVSLAAPSNDLELREKAAFWLANERGKEGFAAIQRFAREDADARFREKLTFDLTLSKEPAALDELIRMAHSDASPQVRKQAQFWMGTKGGKQVAGDLQEIAVNDPNLPLRKSAVFALSRLPGDEAATQLIQVAQSSKDPEVRKQAVFWLGQSSDPKALDYLTQLLKR